MMPPAWWDETARFVEALEVTQQELFGTLRQQRRALVVGDQIELERLNAVAADAAARLHQLSDWRKRLLEQAATYAAPAASLSVLLGREASLSAELLRGRLQRVQQRFQGLRREAWIQWVISHRSQSVFTELLDLIAHGGRKSPVYNEGQPDAATGGVMLDAAA